MSTTRRFVGAAVVTFADIWAPQDGGDNPTFTFTEGAWVFDWDGTYSITLTGNIGAQIVVAMWGFYEVPIPEGSGDPPVPITQASIQALIDGGASIISIGASITGSAPGDGRITYVPPTQPTTLAELAAMGWTLTVASATPPGSLFVGTTSGNLTLDVPDPPPPLEIIGSGGIEFIGSEGALIESSGFPVDPLIIIGSGGIEFSGSPTLVLSADISGLYTLVKNKTNDTLYQRIGFSVFVGTYDMKIPDPFVKSGFVGN